MMKLTTRALGEIEGHQVVAWRVGTKRRGLLHISDISSQDATASAEIVAIRHLLFTDKVFMRDIHSGEGLALEVSTPVIKKVARGKTSKAHLSTLARFFTTNLQGVTLGTTSPKDEHLPNIGDEVPCVYLSSSESPQYDVFDTPAMGKLRLTQHVLDQFIERLHSGEAKKPLTSLISRLKHEEIKRLPLPDKVALHKIKKYGTIDNLEIWGHDTSQMHFTVVRDPRTAIGTVVTIYRRHPDHQ